MTRTALLGLLLALPMTMACSSKGGPASKSPEPGATTAVAKDDQACAKICQASEQCGDSPTTCNAKCEEWLVHRSRAGIATKAAACAVPKIQTACAEDATRGAARALVTCVDIAGRMELQRDKKSLFVAARAICERGARCGGGSKSDAAACTERLIATSPTPRGLGIFGAIRPEIVQDFASCMQSTACEGSTASCFAEMMGEEGSPEESAPEETAPPSKAPTTSDAPPSTKI
jgi:hypothetical protein